MRLIQIAQSKIILPFDPPTSGKVRDGNWMTHALFLTIGAIGFFIMILSNSKWIYFAGMTMMGFAWGSIVAIPYLMIADAVSPARMGVYMGLINAFICVPQFIGMLTVPLFYKTLLGDDPRNALMLCGFCLLAAAITCFWVKEDVKAYTDDPVIAPGGH